MPNGLIIGKFFPPTIGHKFLIDFALNYLYPNNHLDVIVFGMNKESISPKLRFYALEDAYELYSRLERINIHLHVEDLPQYPHEHPDFWNIYKSRINDYAKIDKNTIVFAGEDYGLSLSEHLGCKFVPVGRDTIHVSGTDVRRNIPKNFDSIIPEMKKFLAGKKIVIFGADSVGKTTLINELKRMSCDIQTYPEYARIWLNSHPRETIVKDDMMQIIQGQWAFEQYSSSKYWNVFDTDILTSLGYWQLFGIPEDFHYNGFVFQLKNNCHYFVLDSEGIPFKADAQRYGGDKRQSDTQFWINLLERYKRPYTLSKKSSTYGRLDELYSLMDKLIDKPK